MIATRTKETITMHSHRATQVALAAAALFAAACHHEKPTTTPGGDGAATPTATQPAGDVAAAKKMKCFGANACTGQGACDVPDGRVAAGSKGHDCAGNNECKGKGWVLLTDADCGTQGGQPL